MKKSLKVLFLSNNMANEELIMKLSVLQQEAGKIEEQIQLVNQQIQEFENLNESLNKFENGKEMLAGLGKGVYFKCRTEDDKLLVNIGENVILKKTGKETVDIVNKQIINLERFKENLLGQIEKINLELQRIVSEARNSADAE